MPADSVISPTPGRSGFCAGSQEFKFNYNQVSHGKNLEQNIYLEPGDQIIVP